MCASPLHPEPFSDEFTRQLLARHRARAAYLRRLKDAEPSVASRNEAARLRQAWEDAADALAPFLASALETPAPPGLPPPCPAEGLDAPIRSASAGPRPHGASRRGSRGRRPPPTLASD